MLVLIIASVLSTVIIALIAWKSRKNSLKLLEKRHRRISPDIKYDYNRFNTKQERRTTISQMTDKVIVETDLQYITLKDDFLELEVLSQIELYEFRCKVCILPILLEDLNNETKKSEKTLGYVRIEGLGVSSAILINRLNKIFNLDLSMENALGKYELKFISKKVNQNAGMISLYCLNEEGNEFDIDINYIDNKINVHFDKNWLMAQT